MEQLIAASYFVQHYHADSIEKHSEQCKYANEMKQRNFGGAVIANKKQTDGGQKHVIQCTLVFPSS